MGFILTKKKHCYTRLPLGFAVIVLFALSPSIIGVIGAWFSEMTTGERCHEGNCSWMVIPWLTLLTLPIGGILMII